jgi:hypothetical protein
VSTAHFALIYDGDALDKSLMDVRDLAPALLATGQLFEEANRVVNKGTTTVSLQVTAGLKPGSFGIDLIASQGLVHHLTGLITADNIQTATNLVMLLFGGRGLLDLLRRLGGETPAKVTPQPDGSVKIETKNSPGTNINVSQNVYNIYQDPHVRQKVGPVVRPLEKQGIDKLEARINNETQLSISKEDVRALSDVNLDERVISDTEEDAALQVSTLSFKEGNKWRFNNGTSTAYYSIADTEFLGKIDKGQEQFGKGDILKCRVRVIAKLTPEGQLKTEHTVTKVLDHTHAPKQQKLLKD